MIDENEITEIEQENIVEETTTTTIETTTTLLFDKKVNNIQSDFDFFGVLSSMFLIIAFFLGLFFVMFVFKVLWILSVIDRGDDNE